MSFLQKQFPYFFALALVVISVAAVPPPFHGLSITSSSRIAVYDDITAEFRLVYSMSSACPQTVAFGQPNIDERKVAVLPLSSVNEDGSLCSGPSPINFVGEANVRREDDLLNKLQLGGMREALENNPNAKQLISTESPPSLLVGWHDGERRCGLKAYPRDTIYFIINEDNGKTISLKKPTQRDNVVIPPLLRALLIVAPNSNICLLADTSSNANGNVVVTVIPDDGSPATTTVATPSGVPSAPSASAAPPASSVAPSPPISTAAPAIPTPSLTAVSSAAPAGTLPSSSPVTQTTPGSPVPSPKSGDPPGVAPVPGASGVPTPTASPVIPVSGVPTATPITVMVPTPSQAGVGAVLPNASPGVIEVVPSPEDNIVVEDTSPPTTDDGSACFPAFSTVIAEYEGAKAMNTLEVGDRVLTDEGFSDVILFTHKDSMARSPFLRITVAGGHSLHISPGHYVYTNKKQLKAGRLLRKGDLLYKSNGHRTMIVSIENMSAVGLFNPQTITGSIVVDELLVSTYTTAVDPVMAHSVLMAPARWIYRVSPRLATVLSKMFKHGSPFMASLLPAGASKVG